MYNPAAGLESHGALAEHRHLCARDVRPALSGK